MAGITNEMVSSAKGWLRIGTRDDEVKQVMEACLIDLSMGGATEVKPSDPVVQQAMKLYLKAQFGYDSKAEQFGQAYEHLKSALALCGDYNGRIADG